MVKNKENAMPSKIKTYDIEHWPDEGESFMVESEDGEYIGIEDIKNLKYQLMKLAAEMITFKNMPPDCEDDWQFPKSISAKQRARIIKHVGKANEQCLQWGLALRECIKNMPQ
jgi:hypothetical protein